MKTMNATMILALVATVGCGGTATQRAASPEGSVISVVHLTPDQSTIGIATDVILYVTLYDQFGSHVSGNVTWAVEAGAGIVQITPFGPSCTVTGLAEGSAEIVATHGSLSNRCTIEVTATLFAPIEIQLPVSLLPAGIAGAVYEPIPFEAANGQATRHWTVISGILPEGLVLHENGILDGTPAHAAAGFTYEFAVQVADDGGSDTRHYSIQINY